MKKVFLLMVFLCLALTTQADPYWKVVDGLVYSIDGDSKTATVCAASDYTKDATYDAGTSGEPVYQGDIVIPATIPNPDDAEQPFKVIAINGDAFSNNTAITSITINAEITTIPDNCFQGCTGLTSFLFGEEVTSIETIGSNAFESCTQLGSIAIPNGVTTINAYAFYGCSGMTEVSIPISVTDIDGNAFDGCAKITTLIISGSGAMNDYDDLSSRPWHSFIGQLTSVVIESGVTKIGNNAFSGSTKLESINIPATITTINNNDFSGYSSLIKVIFANINHLCSFNFNYKSDNPLSIAHHLYFSNQPDVEVTAIDFSGTGITTINQYAFSECWGLERIHIPATVTTIGTDAFDFEKGKEANKTFPKTSFESIESLCRTDFTTMKSNPIYYQNDVYIGTGSTAITTIDIPSTSLKEGRLGANILANASKIVSVSIPMGTTSIGENAFYNCTSLMVANYPSLDAVKTIDYGNEYSKPLRYATYLKVNNVDQSVLTIKDDNVDKDAFANQKWLEKVIFTGNVMKIGKGAFKNCPNLTTAEFNTTTQITIEEEAFKSCMKLTSVNLPDGLVELGKEAFRDCRKLTTVTIPQTCKTLGTGVFLYCWGLTTAVIESSVETIPKSFFYDCSKLNNVTLPNTVTTIDSEAFKTCKALTKFPALEKLTTIKNGAFNGCSGLTSLVLPDKVVFIDKSAFAGCSGITSLTIPESVTDIKSKAFDACTSLDKVFSLISDPTNMTVEADIFGDRASSIDLYVPSTEAESLYKNKEPWNQMKIVARIEATLSFYVNDVKKVSITKMAGLTLESTDLDMINNCVQLGENDQFSGWNEAIPDVMPNENKKFYGYISYIREIDGFKWHLYPEENPGAEENPQKSCMAVLISITDEKANSQKDIEIPSKVTCEEVTYPVEVISSNAFKDRKKIEVVTLPDNDNLKIESEVFKGCSEISEVKNFPNSLMVISDGLFSGCKKLEVIRVKGKENSNSLPETITEIRREAFKGCSNFSLKAFPTNLTTIGYQAFYGSGMTSISFKNIITLDKDIFRECKKLETVVFENDFSMAVPDQTFYGCTLLERVTLGSVNRINQGAFKGCTSLANITIPATVGFIGNEAFAGCKKLQQITEESTEPPYANASAFDADTYTNAILYVPENSYEAYGAADTWNNFNKDNIVVSTDFKLIYLLDGEESHKLVGGVETRTRNVKAGATIKIDDENDALGENENKGREFSGWYFSDCQGKSRVMPNHDVTVKGGLQYFITYYDEKNNKKTESAFYYDNNIEIPVDDLNDSNHKFTITFKEIKKKDNVEDGYEDMTVTQDDVATTEIKMPAKDITAIVTYTQSEAEKVYENLKYRIVDMNTTNPHAVLIDGSQAEGDVDIPPTIDYEGVDKPIPVTVIGNKVFKDNRKLTRITIPESIVEMGTENFAYCFKLASFSISDNSKINTLPKLTFIGCGKLESATLPDGIKTIGDQAFSKCSSLSSVSLPSTLDSIGERAFSECKLLKEITLPQNLNYIGELAFLLALGKDGTLTIHKDATKLPNASEITFDETTYESTTLKTNLPADNDPWTKFEKRVTVSDDGGSGQMGQCKEPSITYNYKDKKLVFNCDEQGATIVYKISVEDQKKGEVTSESEEKKPEGETFLVRKYVVTAYAKKTGMNPSNPKRLELPWYSKGDVNDDGFVTVTDAVEVIKICTGDTDNTGEPTPEPSNE